MRDYMDALLVADCRCWDKDAGSELLRLEVAIAIELSAPLTTEGGGTFMESGLQFNLYFIQIFIVISCLCGVGMF